MMETEVAKTATVAERSEAADAAVVRLRQWGTDTIHVLPEPPFDPWLVGNSSDCAVRLVDRLVAPKHAQLRLDADAWWICDRGTPQGIRQDGLPRRRIPLTPGVEIGVGATTLVAESLRCVRLRGFCQRLLGWGGDRARAVDQALRAIRVARARRSALVLCGEGDLVPIAYALHRCTLGGAAPFIVSDRNRVDTRATVRAPTNVPTGMAAFTAAAGGSLCLRDAGLPHDIDEVIRRAYEPESEVQLVMCMRRQHQGVALSGTVPIQLPPLQIREIELPRIVEEYADDAMAALGARSESFTDSDRRWVTAHAAQSLHEIEKATLRLVALAISPNITQAAARLGMAQVSLARWLQRRPPRDLGTTIIEGCRPSCTSSRPSSPSRVGAARRTASQRSTAGERDA